jgi:hypothetical protein
MFLNVDGRRLRVGSLRSAQRRREILSSDEFQFARQTPPQQSKGTFSRCGFFFGLTVATSKTKGKCREANDRCRRNTLLRGLVHREILSEYDPSAHGRALPVRCRSLVRSLLFVNGNIDFLDLS